MISIPSDEQPAPLKTHLDVSGVEIFLIDDGNKSSKEKYIFTDGRQSSMGAEIFHSRSNRPPLANSSVKKEDPVAVKRLGAVNSFNSTPSVIGRAI